MDETNTRWFRWVARNAPHLFTLVWGMGLGAFGAVLFKAVEVGADAIRV